MAAQRLADELSSAGVPVTAHSTTGLIHHLDQGRLILDPATTIIHDEAALASTRELDPLLAAAEDSGAWVILVGDPANRTRSARAVCGPRSNMPPMHTRVALS